MFSPSATSISSEEGSSDSNAYCYRQASQTDSDYVANDEADELSNVGNSSHDSRSDSNDDSYGKTSQTDNNSGVNDITTELPNIENSSQYSNNDSNGDAYNYSEHTLTDNSSDGANASADEHSGIDNNTNNPLLAKNVAIEIMASGNVNIKKGDKIVVTCDIYSKTSCIINQKLVSSKHVEPNRARRNCPIKGCHAAGLLKLSNHLRQTHKIKNSNTVRKYLNLAKLVSVYACILAYTQSNNYILMIYSHAYKHFV